MGAQGVYVAFDGDGKQSPLIESAAEKALWLAVERGMRVVFWPFGESLDDAVAASVTKPPAQSRTVRKPKPAEQAVVAPVRGSKKSAVTS